MSMPFFYRICQPWGPFGSMDFRWFQPNGSIAERWTARRRGHTSRHSNSGQAAGHMVVFCAKKPWNFSWFSRGKKTESWLFVNVHDPNIPPFQMEWKSVSTCFVVSLNGGAGIVEIFRWMKKCDFRGLPQCNHVLHPCVRNQVTFWENRGFYTKKV